jgi:hypothetical protein
MILYVKMCYICRNFKQLNNMESLAYFTNDTKTCESKPNSVSRLYNTLKERKNKLSRYVNSLNFSCKKSSFLHSNYTLYYIRAEIFHSVSVRNFHLVRNFYTSRHYFVGIFFYSNQIKSI